ncbi:MAG: hypothetical protein ABSH48_28330 [Verrucomicrobiota bacterium]|jgi:hypothetical protein
MSVEMDKNSPYVGRAVRSALGSLEEVRGRLTREYLLVALHTSLVPGANTCLAVLKYG